MIDIERKFKKINSEAKRKVNERVKSERKNTDKNDKQQKLA